MKPSYQWRSPTPPAGSADDHHVPDAADRPDPHPYSDRSTTRSRPRSTSTTIRSFQWVQCAPTADIVATMSRVIQIRDVPDDVHDALADAAEAQGLSLTRYMLRELEHLAKRAQAVRANAAVIRETQAKVRGHVDRDTILTALHEGRGA